MLINIRIILPALLGLLLLACATATGQQPVPEPTATVEATPTAAPARNTTRSGMTGSWDDFQCSPDTPPLFESAEWEQYQSSDVNSIKLPSDRWELLGQEEPGFAIYFLPASNAADGQWSAALTFYTYYEDFIREDLGLTWDEFAQGNLTAIAEDTAAAPNYSLVRQWDVEPKPLPRRYGERPDDPPPPTILDHRAEFRYSRHSGVVDDVVGVEGHVMSKRIGIFAYFVRLDICAENREPEREAVVDKMFDSLADGFYGGYW